MRYGRMNLLFFTKLVIIGVELPVDTIHNSRPIQLYTEEGGFQNGLDKLNNRQSL